MIKTNFKKKYKYNDPALVEFFVKNGYVIIKDLFYKKTINSLSNFINSKITQL